MDPVFAAGAGPQAGRGRTCERPAPTAPRECAYLPSIVQVAVLRAPVVGSMRMFVPGSGT